MGDYLLIGAGFTRNWGGPVSDEITGSLLGELHDDPVLAATLRKGPFEEAFAGFSTGKETGVDAVRLGRFQSSVIGVFDRLNRSLLQRPFEFSNDRAISVSDFLKRFDAIFNLNQDLLLEIHYMQTFIGGKFNGVAIPGMTPAPPQGASDVVDITQWTWRPSGDLAPARGAQPLYKLHGSSNWQTDDGEPVLIMGNAKTGAIESFSVLRSYHEQFKARLHEGNARLMVIGYGFQDQHINEVIQVGSEQCELGTYLVDPRGRDVLIDPKTANAAIKKRRDVEDMNLIGELRRPISSVFAGDLFAHGELMRFFK